MNFSDEHFEDQLRWDLSRLGDEAPSGPTGKALMRSLRRRRARHSTAIAVPVVVLVAGLIVVLVSSDRRVGPGPITSGDNEPSQSVVLISSVRPLPIDASQVEIESAIRRYFSSVGFHGNLFVEKSPGEGLSYGFAGSVPTSFGRLRADLTALFQNFDTISVDLKNCEVHYAMMVFSLEPAKTGLKAKGKECSI